MNESFENDFWLPYDKKVGKDKCFTKWTLLSPTEHLKIKVHVPGFVSTHRNKQYRPNPLSYLNGKMWLDENVKEEEKGKYKMPEQPKLSDYKAPEYDRSLGINHMREKLKRNYENGTPIRDFGNIYTTLLTERCGMEIPDMVEHDNRLRRLQEKLRVRNRFEEQYTGDVDSDTRNDNLSWFLKSCKESGRKIYEEI